LRKFGLETGLAFQIADDVLDATSSPEELGKTPGKDLRAGKATYPAAVGVAAAKRAAEAMARRAARRLDGLGPRARTLRDLALFAARRGR
jgi:geranylgeranyl pyrophosphate synthase